MIVNIDLDQCTSCGLCDPICPADVIHTAFSNAWMVVVSPEDDKVDTVLSGKRGTTDEEILLDLQKLIFRYDVSILKSEERLSAGLVELGDIGEKLNRTKASHTHGFVRLRETEAMVDAARLIFTASRVRQESRLSHIREDYPKQDDRNCLRWVLLRQQGDQPQIWTETIATPLVPAPDGVSP
jgi:succinate dehydrogenase/fumarate reductase flavoprotein subunit